MIFPPVSRIAPARRYALTRPSHMQDDVPATATAVTPVQAVSMSQSRSFMARSFSAQLLELGLRYGMDDLIRKADGSFTLPRATRHYERVQRDFTADRPDHFYFGFHT